MDIQSTLHIETLKLGSKGSGDSVLVLMHVTYLAHSYIQLTSAFLPAQASPPDYCSGLGTRPVMELDMSSTLSNLLTFKKVCQKQGSDLRGGMIKLHHRSGSFPCAMVRGVSDHPKLMSSSTTGLVPCPLLAGLRRFGRVDMVRAGLRRFNRVEPPQTHVKLHHRSGSLPCAMVPAQVQQG